MTSFRILGLLGLLVGLALGLITDAPGHGRPPKRRLGSLTIFDKKGARGSVVLGDDRFVALFFRKGDEKHIRNYEITGDMKQVNDKYLGYDLRAKNKNVLPREWRGRDRQDIHWEFVRSEEKSPFSGYSRVKNGELKGWWIGLGPLEPAKKESDFLWEQYPHAPLVLVKDKKDAAGMSSTTWLDEWSP